MSYLELPTLDVKNKKQKKSFEIFRRIMRFQLLNHKLNIKVEKLEATFRKRLRKKKKRKEIIKICKTFFPQWNWQRGTALYWPTQFTDRWTYHVHDAKVRQKLHSAPLSVEKSLRHFPWFKFLRHFFLKRNLSLIQNILLSVLSTLK